jgi:hypothetical protein
MTWQLHDPSMHGTDGWLDMPGSYRDAESVARVYLKDLDPREYDPLRGFQLHVRSSPAERAVTVSVRIQPLAWIVNGKTY